MLKVRIIIVLLRFMSLFSLKTSRNVGRLLGKCFSRLPTKTLRTTLVNLELCFPELNDNARLKLARRSLENTFMTITESGAVWLWPEDRILEEIQQVNGQDVMEKALAEKKGVIVIGPHLGNWELMGLYLTRYGPCSQLYQAPKHPAIDQLLYFARGRGGAKMVATDTKGVAALLKALRDGEMVGILPDQVPPPGAGEFAPFFSMAAFTMTLLPKLLQKTGARAVLAVARREKEGFSVNFRAPSDDIYAEHMPSALKALNQSIEDFVRDMPEQYQWEYKRFKYQPEGEKSPYY